MKRALQKPHFVTRFHAKPGIRRLADMLFATSMFLVGLLVLGLGLGSASTAMAENVDTSSIKCMVAMLFYLTEGDFGALIMVVAGISMLISAAFGNYKAATSLLVVAIGAFTLRSFVAIFFNYNPSDTDPNTCKLTGDIVDDGEDDGGLNEDDEGDYGLNEDDEDDEEDEQDSSSGGNGSSGSNGEGWNNEWT